MPIAQSDAQTLYDAQKTNATAANTLLNTGVQLKAGALNNDATTYAGVVKSNADANTKINAQNAQFIQDANFNNAGFDNTQLSSYGKDLNAAAAQDVTNKINVGTTNANNTLARATDNAKLTINENQYAATLGLDASKFNIGELDKFKQLNATITNAEAESNAGYSRTVETAAALAKNDIWKNVVQNTYDSLKTNAGAANTLNNLFTTGNITLANALASHLWTMAENEDTHNKTIIRDSLLNTLAMQKSSQDIKLTGQIDFDSKLLALKYGQLGNETSAAAQIGSQYLAGLGATLTKDNLNISGKTQAANTLGAASSAIVAGITKASATLGGYKDTSSYDIATSTLQKAADGFNIINSLPLSKTEPLVTG